MDILALTHRTPFPPDRGDRIRSYHLLSRLGQRHRVWLGAVDDGVEEGATHEALESFCHEHAVFTLGPLRRGAGALLSLGRGRPLTLAWFEHPGLHEQLRRWSGSTRFDAAYVFSSSMGPYWQRLRQAGGPPAIMDFIDVDSEKWRQYARYSRPPRRWIYAREQRTLARYEIELAEAAHRSLFVSRAEVRTFEEIAPGQEALALGNGVDGGHFALPELARRLDPPHLVFVGQMDYGANVDAVCWFVEKVLPLLHARRPDLRLDIVGARPSPEVKDLERQEGVRVTGWVEDIRPHLWEATVAVAPLRIAQGTQNKVLEAMAASVPVVASPLAARGLARPSGPHLRVADAPCDFAREILELIDDPVAARMQAAAALEMVRECHSWEAAARRLEELLEEAAGSVA